MYYQKLKQVLSDMEAGRILTKTGDRFSPGTLTVYYNALAWIQRYEKSGGRQNRDDYFRDFQIFLTTQGLAKNTISVLVSNSRSMARHEKSIFLPKLESISTELTTKVYNTLEELRNITELDLGETPGYERLRDIYVLHCNTGLRFSDLQRVLANLPSYLKSASGNQYLRLTTHKTREDIVIPLSSAAREIIEKRHGDFGRMVSLVFYNKAIKEIGRRAGIDEPVSKYMTKGGRMTEEYLPKYKLMGSHTGRRTFATNAWLSGVPERKIMKITGHTSEAAFKRYLRADALESALSLADHPFFK